MLKALLLTSFLIIPVHDAGEAWVYPPECCHDQHCRPVVCDEIESGMDGGVVWDGLKFNKNQVKMSGNSKCHVCFSTYGDEAGKDFRAPLCAFILPSA